MEDEGTERWKNGEEKRRESEFQVQEEMRREIDRRRCECGGMGIERQ